MKSMAQGIESLSNQAQLAGGPRSESESEDKISRNTRRRGRAFMPGAPKGRRGNTPKRLVG
jgi:hypothetical protein